MKSNIEGEDNLMKRMVVCIIALFMVSLCGCSFVSELATNDNIETLKSWSFQYNEGTSDYSLFFGLCDESGKFISADVDVDIRIVNDKNEEIYKGTKSVSKDDFSYYSSKVAGEQYLANVRIAEKEIKEGKSESGTVYLTVYKDNVISFDEVNCSALNCLPISAVTLTTDPLPISINIKGYDGSVESKIEINDVSYVYEKSITPQLKITISGVKTYGTKSSSYDMISYKLYDSNGYLVDSANVYLSSLEKGDKFKDDSIVIYDITPGENYSLKITEYDW